MEFDIIRDLVIFGLSIFCGLFMGIIFDLYRAIRRIFKPKVLLSYLEDLIFWIIIGGIFFALLINTTDGILRGFVFIGVFVGVLLYMILLSNYILPLFILIFKLILNVFNEIIKVIKKPFAKILLLIRVYFKEMTKYSKMIFKKK